MSKCIGHCLCGAVRFAFDGRRVSDPALSHDPAECRAHAAAAVASFLLPDTAWRWTGDPPRRHARPDGTVRQFCATCGTPMALSEAGGRTRLFMATLEDPRILRPETEHAATDRPDWLGPLEKG